jgi:hypothetical protein
MGVLNIVEYEKQGSCRKIFDRRFQFALRQFGGQIDLGDHALMIVALRQTVQFFSVGLFGLDAEPRQFIPQLRQTFVLPLPVNPDLVDFVRRMVQRGLDRVQTP